MADLYMPLTDGERLKIFRLLVQLPQRIRFSYGITPAVCVNQFLLGISSQCSFYICIPLRLA